MSLKKKVKKHLVPLVMKIMVVMVVVVMAAAVVVQQKVKKMLIRPTVVNIVYVRVYLSCVIKIHLMKKIKVL